MKIAVIGSRNCPYIDLEDYITTLPDVIVSGGAKGVDTYAREFALKHDIEFIEFKPDYKKYGRRAPLVRNKQIVDECDSLIAIWDGYSTGTKHAIRYANKMNKPVTIFYAPGEEWMLFEDQKEENIQIKSEICNLFCTCVVKADTIILHKNLFF